MHMLVFGLWREVGVPKDKTFRTRDNMQTLHRKAAAS